MRTTRLLTILLPLAVMAMAGCELPVGLDWGGVGDGFGGGWTWPEPDPVTRPVAVAGGHAFAAVDAGFDHTCARDTAGGAWCWGAGGLGQLGSGTFVATTPVAVEWDDAFDALSVDHTVSCGVSAARLVCWGSAVGLPVRAEDGPREPWPGLEVASVSVGGAAFVADGGSGLIHLCAAGTDGRAHCAGANYFGQLGRGTTALDDTVMAAVPGLEDVVQVTTGWLHSCALLASGEAWCWGGAEQGELGTGSEPLEECAYAGLVVPCAPAPVRVQTTARFRALAAGWGRTCGIDDAGELYCWGRDVAEPWIHTPHPTRVDPAAFGGLPVTAVSLGDWHLCALVEGGAAYCWGENGRGQLGTGSTEPRSTPTAVATDLRFRSISAGPAYTCAVTPEDAAYCWGDDTLGKLGDGD